MEILNKLEALINSFLFKLGELMWKLVPVKVKNFFKNIEYWKTRAIQFFKSLPAIVLKWLISTFKSLKVLASEFNFKNKLLETYKVASEKYKKNAPAKYASVLKIFATPFLMISEWLSGLSTGQSLLLLAFTGGSILGIIGIGFSGRKLVNNHLDQNRTPASAEEIAYKRPGYYKKETRHFDLTNLRLPVYVAQVNEIRSVDIDFTATLSNRHSRKFLEKLELQLRDHLILQIEPSVASFPLEDEGKEIIRKKVHMEIDEFLNLHKIHAF